MVGFLFAFLVVFNATFHNISVITQRSVLLVGEPEDPEKTTDLSQVTDKLDNGWVHRISLIEIILCICQVLC
jgi:hypothetical protein